MTISVTACVVILIVVVLLAFLPGGHSAEWNRGYAYGLNADELQSGGPTESHSGNGIDVAFTPSNQVCTADAIGATQLLSGVGDLPSYDVPPEELRAEAQPTADFISGCIAGVEQMNANFLQSRHLSTSCGDWGNVSGLLPGC